MSASEAESLFLAGLPGVAADLGLGRAAAEARLKLTAALPAGLSERAVRWQDRFHLDALAWYQEADPIPHLTAVAAAVWQQHRVRLRYLRWESPHEVTRTVDPHGLVLKGGQWYLVARRADGFRVYRVFRILDLRLLDESFDRAAGFDLAAHWRAHLDAFDARRHGSHAVLRLSPTAVERLPYLAESRPSSTRPAGAREPNRTAGYASPSRSRARLRRCGPSSVPVLRANAGTSWPRIVSASSAMVRGRGCAWAGTARAVPPTTRAKLVATAVTVRRIVRKSASCG
ncbi:WYL domain-containing protein [Streptomyces morookaense]|uniref:helix-turn-helix transcriptional regulator n=1 Tax=Streptomyces morookaense TaxID=1970 RepID=UPI0033F78FD7